MISMWKDIHDVTGSAVLMVGEDRVNSLLRRFESFYNRMNRGALKHLTSHSEEDVRAVIDHRCDFPVDPRVSSAIYGETGGRSMRSVIDRIRDMEAFARSNSATRITMKEYRKLMGFVGTLCVNPRPTAAALEAVSA